MRRSPSPSIWITDSGDGLEGLPDRAGWLTAGGGPVPGWAAREGSVGYHYDGERLEPRPDAFAPRVVVADPGLAPLVLGVVEAWAGARGHALERRPAAKTEAGEVPALRIDRARGAELGSVRLARDGWWLEGPTRATERAGTVWLEAPPGSPVVTWESGVVAWGLGGAELGGDSAAFAISLARLFDAAVLSDPEVVPVAERRSAGAPGYRAPRIAEEADGASGGAASPDPRRGPTDDSRPVALLALAAVALGALALFLPGAGLR